MNRAFIIFSTLGLGVVLSSLYAFRTRDFRNEIGRSQENLVLLKNEVVSAQVSNEAAGKRIAQIEKEARVAAERLASEIAGIGTGINDIWSNPPKEWPEWNLKSPFIWVDKEVLPILPLQTIGKEGEISKDSAWILGISGAQLERLNQILGEIVAENRTLAQNSAQIVNEDVLSTGPTDGTKITVKIEVPQETTAALKDRYESAIRDEIGEDRQELLCHSLVGQNWLNTEFGAKPELISVVRNSNGTYNIGFKERGSSYGGVTSLDGYVPDFALPLFDAIRNKSE